EDAAFGVERTFGRVEVFGNVAALLVFRVERARGEGDDLAGLVGDGEGNALAEARVHRTGRAVGLLPGAEETAGAECFFGKVLAQGIAHGVEVIRGVANAECFDGFRLDAAAGEIFAGSRALGGFELRL